MLKLQPLVLRWAKGRHFYQIQEFAKWSATEVKPVSNEELEPKPTNVKDKIFNEKASLSLVESAFQNLGDFKDDSSPELSEKDKTLEERIKKVKTVDSILQLANSNVLSPHHMMKIISILGDWTNENKVQLSDFEKDNRFVKMCKKLGNEKLMKFNSVKDLSTVLGVASDDEAAKMIGSITLPQMIKVLSKLAVRKRRSTPILRSLSFNMTKSEEKLNLKQVSDVLFSVCVLNFPDEVLLTKVCNDAVGNIPTLDGNKSSVIGSISTSLGMLRYHDSQLLDTMSDWMVRNIQLCRVQDVLSFVMTLALVNYLPTNQEQLFQTISPFLKPSELPSPHVYLDLVWSYVLLDKATPEQISTVLSSNFVQKLTFSGKELSVAAKLKLLNINGFAVSLGSSYQGNLIDRKLIGDVPLTRSKEKQLLVNNVMETFANLLPSVTYLKKDVDTGYGYLLDGECRLDNKRNPIPVNKTTEGVKVGIFVLDYQDTCKGARYKTNGIVKFIQELLVSNGYRILTVPYFEFNDKAKLLQRVQYLEKKLKT